MIGDFNPRLSHDALYILSQASYEKPLFINKRERVREIVNYLTDRGLLERHPDQDLWRRTEAGDEVLKAWKKAGF